MFFKSVRRVQFVARKQSREQSSEVQPRGIRPSALVIFMIAALFIIRILKKIETAIQRVKEMIMS